jgi:glycosyltransferase involved in cell wall biosynthesis
MLAKASPALFRSPWRRLSPIPRPLFLASFPPRECGIATFTDDIKIAVETRLGEIADVIAVDDGKAYRYPACVIGTIERDDPASYAAAAELINAHSSEVLNIQHEYGLFGGDRGETLIELMAHVVKPIVTTLHTVLPAPDPALRRITRELCNRSDAVIALAQRGKRLLEDDYGIDPRKVRVILHGAPDVPLRSSRPFKRRLGLGGKTVISTFGLLSPSKGIEYLLEALPAIFERHPRAVYQLLGETHPQIRRHEGEAYRESLMRRVEQLGIADRVRFENHYMTGDEIIEHLLATDVYVSPSLDPNQIVSGTLSYAVACGRVVVATASAYARELLADGRGVAVAFRSAAALKLGIDAVLADPRRRAAMETAAYRFGRRMIWPRVAREYEAVFRDAALVGRFKFRSPAGVPGAELFAAPLRAVRSTSLVNAAE